MPAEPAAPSPEPARLSPGEVLRRQIAELEHGRETDWGVAPFGDARIDACLPGGGLPLGRLHEIAGGGRECETPAAATGFVAGLAQRVMKDGMVVWVLQRDDLYALGLQAFVLRRNLYAAPRARSARADGVAATTRWRIAPAASAAPEIQGVLGAPRWRAMLDRCRGGRTGAWLLQSENEHDASTQTRAVRVVAELADHALAAGATEIRAASARPRADGGERERATAHRN